MYNLVFVYLLAILSLIIFDYKDTRGEYQQHHMHVIIHRSTVKK